MNDGSRARGDLSKGEGIAGGLTNYGDKDFSLYLRKSFAKSMGYSDEMLARPIVGICYTESGFNNCHRNFPELLEAVKRGVLTSGALPVPFPVTSLGEAFISPTSMKFRNLMSMDVEEMIRAQPMDAVVLMGGCDKTVPALLMGAASANKPAVMLVAGPMMTGRHKGQRLGACTDCRKFWGRHRSGQVSDEEIAQVEGRLATTAGTCAVMGTASTMALIAETLGMSVPGSAAIPAVHADRLRAAEQSGILATRLIGSDLTPEKLITKASVENALRVLLAVSGSTNAVIHLAAIAGRLGIKTDLDAFNELSDETPVLVNIKPVGSHYMEDFHAAGALDGILHAIEDRLNLDTPSVAGETLGERLERPLADPIDRSVIRTTQDPIDPHGGLIILKGSLAPQGAMFKRAAASMELFEHEGRAIVFSSLDDLANRIDDPDLDVASNDVLVLQNAGPASAAAMPEAGYLPIPKKLAVQGVKDMVRISDARMSGTAFGTIILHVTPESCVGGPLALVRTGDRIRLSVANKSIDLLVDEAELAKRREEFKPAVEKAERGYSKLYQQSILPATKGCDFDFLTKSGGSA